ncbi:phenylalanine--tRNA ligase subunit beta [Sphingomonas sp. GCM10030256]|uniref:phenylalanine--tRNA ligase subunit beta n=1 Tax=Sphingomonas sp. GCM10030256 TaxID=3273427 RepID=UPI0036121C39
MKFTLSWLKDHLETNASPAEIADRLTAIGLEVESVTNPAEKLAPFRVAEVLTAEKHPKADKLQVLSVDAGDGPLQVVCGAPNARTGMKGVFGPPGAYVPGIDMTLKVAAIRGVESNGMMCSVRELQLGDEHEGIIELPADAPVGQSFADYAGLDDPVFDIATTPNRPDCLGVDGIARDLAAAGLGQFKVSARTRGLVEGGFEPEPRVVVEPDSGCWVFWRRVIRGVRNGPSPKWLQQRLTEVGLRPISALVDVTNFFSIDQARPLHVYDVSKVQGRITARRGREGDRFLALNGKDYAPTPADCVIADEGGAIGLGGVIGGDRTGVDETTTDVLLECAWFDPEVIGATGRRHNVSTDARSRFERGIDPEKLSTAIESATQMILDLCGGEASEPRLSGDFPADGYPNRTHWLVHRPVRVRELGGVALDAKEQLAILGRLGFFAMDVEDPDSFLNEGERLAARAALQAAGPGAWVVRVPTWRPDIDGQADLVEEIVRIHGLDGVPATPLPREEGVAKPVATPAQRLERRIRRAAAARGLDEAVTWSFIGEADAAAFGGAPWVLANPISEEMKVMRPSLLPGLIGAARRNIDRGAASVRLFEVGRRYLADGERPTLTVLLAGEREPRGWRTGKATPFDAFDIKGEVIGLLEAAGAPVANLQLYPDAGDTWHPGRSAKLGLGPKTIVATFGELHPRLAKLLDAPVGAVAAEIFLDAIPQPRDKGRARPAFAPPALQPIHRDFAFVVPDDLSADGLVRAIRGVDRALITDARVFDRYQPDGGELSLAVDVTIQPSDKTLTDAEIGTVSDRIIAAAAKLGARLRS